MKRKAIVIGAGINGLVAANYLQKGGFEVTILERKERAGGACTRETLTVNGRDYIYPGAATVLGFMQDFVLKETGLSRKLTLHAPVHPLVVWFESLSEVCYLHDNIGKLKKELRRKWGEEGDIAAYYNDMEKVRRFILHGYRNARVPTLSQAQQKLGEKLTQRWIAGSARDLLNHYFSSDAMKVFSSIDVTESGPVSLDSPYSAFSIPLMNSGSVFDGGWGFVKGGLWQLTEGLQQINEEIGVRVLTSIEVLSINAAEHQVKFRRGDKVETLQADQLLFATDPLTAARLLGEQELIETVSKKKGLGTSGKVVMLFDKPVQWIDESGEDDYASAFKFIISAKNLDEIEQSSRETAEGNHDFIPTYFELYCESAGQRSMGADSGYDAVTVFFKSLSFSKPAEALPEVKRAVETTVLAKVTNKEDLIASVMFTPKDLSEKFFFPAGNIDHIELQEGQTFFARNYSPHAEDKFYQFGNVEGVSYCAAGTYPCGSIAGTAGYMCARQILNATERKLLSPLAKSE